MKKRVLSMALAIAMIVVSLFAFSTPVNADNVVYNLQQPHTEMLINLVDDDNYTAARNISFTVPHNGYYIIQTMGFPTDPTMNNGMCGLMTLKNSANQTVATTHGQTNRGYGRGKLFHCELSMYETYTLHISVSGAEAVRIVITCAENLFDQWVPIDHYNDITSFEPGVIEFTITEDDCKQAQVVLVEHDNDEITQFEVEIDGCSAARVILIDPRSWENSGSVWLYTDCVVTLDKDVPYFLVVYIDLGDIPVDFPLYVTVKFTPVE